MGGAGRSTWAAIAIALALGAAAPSSAAVVPHGESAAAKKCKRAIVGGKHVCLKKGQRCEKAFQVAYLPAGFDCAKGRLRKASIAERRGPEPYLLDAKGRMSLGTALAGFDGTVADLPGVKARKGEIGKVTDATMIVEEIEAHVDRLSPEQRAVFTQATTPSPTAVGVDAKAPPTPQEEILAQEWLDQALRVYRNHGFFPAKRVTVTLLEGQGTTAATSLGYTTGGDIGTTGAAACNTFVTGRGRAQSTDDVRLTIAHEAAHCLQHAFYSSQSQAASLPGWIKEGSAEWLGAAAMRELGGSPTQVDWGPWLANNDLDLFGRAYDAVGFYAMLEQAGIDPWARIRAIIAAAVGGGGPAGFQAAIAGAPDVFFSRWGPGLARDASLGPEWNYEGPFIRASNLKTKSISNGGKPGVSTMQARGSAAGKLNISADVVTIQADKDLRGLLYTNGAARKLSKGAYCAKPSGCKCRTHANLALPKLGSTATFGYSDTAKPRTVTFSGRSLKDYCKNPRPGPAGGGSGGACPAPPTPQARARADGASCPVSDGIRVLHASSGSPQYTQVALFKTADCTAGGSFTAIATDGDYRLEIGVSGFSGFGEYPISTGGTDPTFVVDGPLGTFGNQFPSPVAPVGNGAGGINFINGGRQFGFAFGPTWSAAGGAGGNMTLAGDATCIYPDD